MGGMQVARGGPDLEVKRLRGPRFFAVEVGRKINGSWVYPVSQTREASDPKPDNGGSLLATRLVENYFVTSLTRARVILETNPESD